jgi:small subunit ribosomal protein S2
LKLTRHSLRCIQVIAGVLGRAGEAGQKQRLAAAAEGKITYRAATNLVAPTTEVEEAKAAQVTKGYRDATETEAVSSAADADAEFAKHLDEVDNHEDHRQKGGRAIKFSD